MLMRQGVLTYCTNIHAGDGWKDHFGALRENIPGIKGKISGDGAMGIGLRLSNQASVELQEGQALGEFKGWLRENDCFVFTMNGFPYGGFHHTRVKDHVHAPDWTTRERVAYTIRLFDILKQLLPDNMEGGISTSPLSYKHWHGRAQYPEVFRKTTEHILEVVRHLIGIREATGKLLHLDIEPEPDGLLESGPEFLDWYEHFLLPMGREYLERHSGLGGAAAEDAIRDHVQLCYDVCHFAVGYEDHADVVSRLREKKIKTGKIQISAALKAELPADKIKRDAVLQAFRQFNESTYLHQVVAREAGGSLKRYPDLPEALGDTDSTAREWRSHFHVPLFIQDYGLLHSTQEDIRTVLALQSATPFTRHLEVETYTWEVLPDALKLPLSESITREMGWVIDFLKQ